MANNFVSVIFPLALPNVYSYAVPTALQNAIQIGVRVEVPLKNKLYSAIIAEIHDKNVSSFNIKEVISVLDRVPILTKQQIDFWKWISDYYCCSLGEVMNVAMPSGLKLESETKVIFNGAFQDLMHELSDDEYLIAEAVSIQNELSILQIQDILNKKTIFPVLRSLLDKQVITIKEELIQKFKPKMVKYLTLNEPYLSEPNQLSDAFDLVSKSEYQTKALLAFVQLSRNKVFTFPVSDISTLASVDSSVVKAIAKKGIFTIYEDIQSRIFDNNNIEKEPISPLNPLQIESVEQITAIFENKKPCLLHGITGSGKTRVYSELIKKCLAENKQCLYLLPEIALTNNMVTRLKAIFGQDILVYHSRMNNQERVEIWNATLQGAKMIIAARSGIFLPYSNLGLIIVDEEHDPSFKQNEPNPRYNARDAAIYLSHLTNANIIMGSATPSMESFYNAISNKYGYVQMMERYGESVLPNIELVNLKNEHKDKRFLGLFSQSLIENIEEALLKKEQVLIFQNRRGYSPTITCNMCGWKADCNNCDVKMTVHKTFRELRCHYCGSRSKIPTQCPACGHDDLLEQGFGTEKIEEHIKEIFPTALIARLDMDTAKTKLAYENIIQDFEDRKIDILVGTQMITKGLDFDNISLVGVLNADGILRYPDMRANERAFQLLTQVAGRAGRRKKQGKVIIQTYDPKHPVIIETVQHAFEKFYQRESKERKLYHYPPYYRMIQIELLHKDAGTVAHAANVYAAQVKEKIGNRLLGPAIPSISRIRGQYIQTITIKMEKDPKVVHNIKTLLLETRSKLKQIPNIKSVKINIDVDPY